MSLAAKNMHANAAQRRAADPGISAWVSANAGSGKTTVLVNRVVRLLLTGTPPGRILCLTFTKAAAAEMTNRLFGALSRWAVCSDAQLEGEIGALLGGKIGPDHLLAGRRLFAQALETPGGLKIQTIHAFCEALLHRFPVEAEVPAGFDVLDDAAARELRAQAIAQMSMRAGRDGYETLKEALGVIASHIGEARFEQLIATTLDARDELARFIAAYHGLAAGLGVLKTALGLAPDDDEMSLKEAIAGRHAIDTALLEEMLLELEASSPNDKKLGARIAAALDAETLEGRVAAYRGLFHTQAGSPRAALTTKGFAEQFPGFAGYLEAERARIVPYFARLKAVLQWRASAALLTAADATLGLYEALKTRRGRLDYHDLIARTEQLLAKTGHAWVLYKLDGGIDHILIDEAQDTSPGQWRVVQYLAEEFFSGEGARAPGRTVFAVGDEKQSIFSFQGADPAMFDAMRRYFAKKAEDAGQGFSRVPLTISYRSTEAVLWAVDKVFETPPARQGLTAADIIEAHQTSRLGEAGRVEIWPTERPDEEAQKTPWQAPLDWQSPDSPQIKLARRIAGQIAHWLENKTPLPATPRPIRPEDILILVRRRGQFVDAMLRALKERGVPVAGADRMVLSKQISVMDLVALADAALLPEDDLTLATVLKGPLIGLSEDELFALAFERGGTLWQALRAHAETDERSAKALRQLSDWFARARAVAPFEFFSNVLSRNGGRRALARRFGEEVNDPIDEFLNLTLDYERTGPASLQGFLAWFAETGAEIKRDLATPREEVRIMTVHGAKGLEAPIVILPDTCSLPDKAKLTPLLFLDGPPDNPDAAPLPVWRLNRSMETQEVSRAREHAEQAALEEYRRLLYVAMTRGSEKLIVTGYEGKQKRPEGCWYDLIADALLPEMVEHAIPHAAPGDDLRIWVKETGTGTRRTDAVVHASSPGAENAAPLPDWATRPARRERPSLQFESPSRLLGDGHDPVLPQPGPEGETSPIGAAAQRRGVITHKLLRVLAGGEISSRASMAQRMLDAIAHDLDETVRAEILDEITGLFADPEIAPLLTELPGRSEVPVAGRIALKEGAVRLIAGRIDRLVFSGDDVMIVDYKTDRDMPQEAAHIPPAYLTQLAAYRAVVRELYPDRTVSCALIWTARAMVMRVSDALLDDVLDEVE